MHELIIGQTLIFQREKKTDKNFKVTFFALIFYIFTVHGHSVVLMCIDTCQTIEKRVYFQFSSILPI